MGILVILQSIVTSVSPIGAGKLRDAADPNKTSNRPGVYVLILNGDIKKAGSAKIGIQKRMQQYYDRNNCCGLNEHITLDNRDKIMAKWQYCEQNQCEELESKLNDKYEMSNSMEWSERRPRTSRDSVKLLI